MILIFLKCTILYKYVAVLQITPFDNMTRNAYSSLDFIELFMLSERESSFYQSCLHSSLTVTVQGVAYFSHTSVH